MQTQIYLIAPADADPQSFATALQAALEQTPASALLLPRGTRAENAYKQFCKAIIPIAQGADCAVLVEGEPGLVRLLGADGLHVTGGIEAAQPAIAALRPAGLIVGVGEIGSRDEAMTLGELEPDYLFFGTLEGRASAAQRDMAQWWAQTMEIPAVLGDPDATEHETDAAGCEFIGLRVAVLETTR
jgi:thiamine-phosphate pyrophosphorylase